MINAVFQFSPLTMACIQVFLKLLDRETKFQGPHTKRSFNAHSVFIPLLEKVFQCVQQTKYIVGSSLRYRFNFITLNSPTISIRFLILLTTKARVQLFRFDANITVIF